MQRKPIITAVSCPVAPVYMSSAAPTAIPNRAPWAWFCRAGAAFCRVGVGLVELGPVTTGSASTKLVVVTITTPPLSMVDVKVDVTGFSEAGDEVGLLVVDSGAPGDVLDRPDVVLEVEGGSVVVLDEPRLVGVELCPGGLEVVGVVEV